MRHSEADTWRLTCGAFKCDQVMRCSEAYNWRLTCGAFKRDQVMTVSGGVEVSGWVALVAVVQELRGCCCPTLQNTPRLRMSVNYSFGKIIQKKIYKNSPLGCVHVWKAST